jgi:Phage terminase large subunit
MKFFTTPVFQPLFTINKKYVVLKSGRLGGKSKVAYQVAITKMLANPYHDVIVCRDSYSDLTTSSYAEIVNFIHENKLSDMFVVYKSPLRIVKKADGASIYFLGIGGSDMSRTKSFETKHPVCCIVFEELQQVRGEESLYQAHASFRRLLDPDCWVIMHMFNPPAQNAHWVNVWANLKMADPDYLVIHTTYMDILPFINDIDLKEIIKEKLLDFEKYKWLYLGQPGGGFGSVYPQFKRAKHFITLEEAQHKFGNFKIVGLIIGGDGAVNNDCTVMTPKAILNNGQTLELDIFYHDPKKAGVKSSAELIPYMRMWLNMLMDKYNMRDEYMPIPILFKIDSAAADLIRQVAYEFARDNIIVEKFTKSTIYEMVGIVQSAISRNMTYIIDFGGYYDYVLGKWIKADHPLAVQLENLIWDKKQKGYDPIVSNDASDAYTYNTITYFKNPDNMYWLENIIRLRREFYDVEFISNK